MKNICFILLFFVMLPCSGAQTSGIMSKGGTSSSEMPSVVVNQFKKDYPACNPVWSKENYNYRADYTDPKTNLAGLVVYDVNGRALRTETELQANSYPGAIGDYYTSTLPKATKYRVYSFRDTTGVQSYYSTSNGQTYYFDKDGNYISPSDNRVKPASYKK